MKKYIFLAGLSIVVLLLCGCSGVSTGSSQDKLTLVGENFKPSENKDIYEKDNKDVENIYLTITKGKDNSLGNLNSYKYNWVSKVEKPEIKVLFSTKEGSVLDSINKYNAIIEPRGHSTANAAQKSIKVRLMDSAGLWHDQKVLNLNKHPYDMVRVRNKLSFDYLKEIPDYFSFRTQFCHVYIRDLNDSKSSDYVDYGLFTNIESMNKSYLKSHQIMDNGYVYKANQFEFNREPDKLKNADEKGYNKDEFEKILKIELAGEGDKDNHERFLKMLDDVNNANMNINDIIDKHFDRNNYLTWLATNILMGNMDTNSQNFFLASPVTSNKWYFIPWDYDAAWNYWKNYKDGKNYASWQREGISNYWGVVLHKRFFKDSKNIKDLSAKIEELSKLFTRENTEKMLKEYRKETEKIVKSVPDVKYLTNSIDYYDKDFESILSAVDENKASYYENLKKPMPVFLGEVSKEKAEYVFEWDDSYDFEGNKLTYNFQLSSTPDMKKIIHQKSDLNGNKMSVKGLSPGTYYWTVDVKNSKGKTQIPFDSYTDASGNKFHGVKTVVIK